MSSKSLRVVALRGLRSIGVGVRCLSALLAFIFFGRYRKCIDGTLDDRSIGVFVALR